MEKSKKGPGKSGPKRVSARGARLQKERAPKIVENTKNAIFLRGTKTSEACGHALKELFSLRKPHGKMMQRKNENVRPFDEVASLEFLCQKNDCSLFAVASHSKRRSCPSSTPRTKQWTTTGTPAS